MCVSETEQCVQYDQVQVMQGVINTWMYVMYDSEEMNLYTYMGAEPKNSFKGGPRGPLYGILTTRHHRLRDYVSPNQSCKVFGDFGQKSWLTSRHVCGHVTRVTCLVRVPWSGPWAVDNSRHWNFSICSNNIGDMAILVEGYDHKKDYFFKRFYCCTPSLKWPCFFSKLKNFSV